MTIKIDFEGVRWVECAKVKDFVVDISERIVDKNGKFGKTPDCVLRTISVCAEELLEEKITELTGEKDGK